MSDLAIQEATDRFAFVGGAREEYIKYFHRADLPAVMWHFVPASEAKALAGFSAVAKKDGVKQRKLLMAVPANLQWVSSARRLKLGLHGGGALGMLQASDGWRISAFDADNAFTRIRTPSWCWGWLSCPPC